MYIYYKGKELTGYTETITAIQGGYVAKVNDEYRGYIDWSGLDYYKPLSEEAATTGVKLHTKPYVEYWTRDDDNTIVSDTFRPTKMSDGENKDPDEYGYRWTKIKRDLTDDEQSASVEFTKAVLLGYITVYYEKQVKDLDIHESKFETETWSTQVEQAKAYQADSTEGTLIKALADARGISLDDMATKILDKNTAWQTSVGSILGKLQKRRAEIKAITTQASIIEAMDKYMNVSHTSDLAEAPVLDPDYDAMAIYAEDL